MLRRALAVEPLGKHAAHQHERKAGQRHHAAQHHIGGIAQAQRQRAAGDLHHLQQRGHEQQQFCGQKGKRGLPGLAVKEVERPEQQRRKAQRNFGVLQLHPAVIVHFPHDRFRGKNPMGVRGDAIVQFDWSVGQIMETLDKLGLAENTLIILSSDNGPVVDDGYDDKAEELLNGHSPAGPWRGNKYSAFEGGTAVPAIVRWPKKIKENRESDVLMSQIDWMASLGALVNARLPKGSAPDSYNRIGNLLGTDDEDRPWVIELASNHVLSVRTKDWKYIEPNDGPAMIQWGPKIETGNLSTPQLYDMRKDINERANVASQHPEVVYDMQNILRRVRNKTIKME